MRIMMSLYGFVEKRKHNHKYLKELLTPISDKVILPEALPGSEPSWFGFMITLKEGMDRKKVVPYIESKGIQTRMLFAGNLTKHPCFDQMRAEGDKYRIVGDLKNTDRIMNDTFWVGVYPGMNDKKLEYMAKIIIEAINL